MFGRVCCYLGTLPTINKLQSVASFLCQLYAFYYRLKIKMASRTQKVWSQATVQSRSTYYRHVSIRRQTSSQFVLSISDLQIPQTLPIVGNDGRRSTPWSQALHYTSFYNYSTEWNTDVLLNYQKFQGLATIIQMTFWFIYY